MQRARTHLFALARLLFRPALAVQDAGARHRWPLPGGVRGLCGDLRELAYMTLKRETASTMRTASSSVRASTSAIGHACSYRPGWILAR